MDLTKGYWQIPVAKESQLKTAFVTPVGKFEFKTMPFGLAGTPAVFQRYMNTLLADVPHYSAAYLNDIVVFSTSWEDHLRHLRDVLGRIRESGLTIKIQKCRWAQQTTEFLGRGGTVRPR